MIDAKARQSLEFVVDLLSSVRGLGLGDEHNHDCPGRLDPRTCECGLADLDAAIEQVKEVLSSTT